jgi:hypothetical protein
MLMNMKVGQAEVILEQDGMAVIMDDAEMCNLFVLLVLGAMINQEVLLDPAQLDQVFSIEVMTRRMLRVILLLLLTRGDHPLVVMVLLVVGGGLACDDKNPKVQKSNE